jgi:hypothetical protein
MAYSERRGPNVSEYVANLNAIPSAQDLQSSNADNYNLDDELAMFTNTQFFDFDAGQEADLHLGGFGSEGPARAAAPESKEMTPLDFLQGACDSDIRGLGVYSCCLSCAVCACVCGSAVVVCLFLDYHCYRWWCALSHMHLLYTGRDITLSSCTIPSPPPPPRVLHHHQSLAPCRCLYSTLQLKIPRAQVARFSCTCFFCLPSCWCAGMATYHVIPVPPSPLSVLPHSLTSSDSGVGLDA